ncbi:MAG: rhamnonate dehydratase [Ramlibacter sp.]|jgi:L-alanine-DL-glutamate epimerase-like enolase superfamily enzyme|nr:rhamnonate dehydratase [Ramlibacter sp.]
MQRRSFVRAVGEAAAGGFGLLMSTSQAQARDADKDKASAKLPPDGTVAAAMGDIIIKSVTAFPYEMKVESEASNSRRKWSTKTFFFVFIDTQDGLQGVGEGWCSYGNSAALKNTVDLEIAPLMIGKSAFEHTRVVEQVRRAADLSNRLGVAAIAVSACEMAMWDLIGKKLKQPLYKLLGASNPRVPVYASGGLYAPNKSAADLGVEMAGYVKRGFNAVKMKVGANFADDVKRVAAVREALGPDPRLMVDFHYEWDVATTVRFARAIEKYDIQWIESPLPPYDFDGYRRLSAQSPIAITGNETMAWADTFQRYISTDGIHYIELDPSACGGISESLSIAKLAYISGRPCTLHSSSSAVLFAADLHLAASIPNCHSVEYHMFHQWFWDKAPSNWRKVEGGTVRVPEGFGLGVDITSDSFKS